MTTARRAGDDAYPYLYFWHRCGRKDQRRCRVTARGTLNSCRVEFEDGFAMVTSRNALRRAVPLSKKTIT